MPSANVSFNGGHDDIEVELLKVLKKWNPKKMPACIECTDVKDVQALLDLFDALCGLRRHHGGVLEFCVTGVGLNQHVTRTSNDCVEGATSGAISNGVS